MKFALVSEARVHTKKFIVRLLSPKSIPTNYADYNNSSVSVFGIGINNMLSFLSFLLDVAAELSSVELPAAADINSCLKLVGVYHFWDVDEKTLLHRDQKNLENNASVYVKLNLKTSKDVKY